jgi:adenylate cyclase
LQDGERRLAAIMFTDIVGYTALTQKDEKLALGLLEKHRELVRPLLSRHGGREVKTIGDAFLIEFASALDAVECAAEIQKVLADYNRTTTDKISLRIGVHVGDVVHKGQDVYGDAVNIASRIQGLAESGGICVSEEVYSQVRNKVPYRMERLPLHTLKNVEYPVETFRVLSPVEAGGSEASAPRNRVAVLPLTNISPDPKDGYFADGLTEELITVLSQVHGLRVIARTSVDHYRGGGQRAAQIGRELGVGSMIEGSVRIAGDRLRVTVQLIDASNEEHLWSENYDRRLDDIFAVQTDIAKRVAKNLEVKLMAKEENRLDRRKVASMSVYKDYLKGRLLLGKREPSEMMEAKRFFEKAISEDPTYAPAYAGLADAYHLLGEYWALPHDEARRVSKEYLAKALKLDPDLAEARATLACNLSEEYRFKDAESEFKHAIDLNPSYAMAHMWYAQCLGSLRRYDEQREQLDIAEQLDPLSTVILYNEVFFLSLIGEKELAWDKLQKRSTLDPSLVSKVEITAVFHLFTGDARLALEELRRHPELHGEIQVMFAIAGASAVLGDREEAEAWLEKIKALPENTARRTEYIAYTYLQLKDYDQFFTWMNRAVDRKEAGFDNIELVPWIKPVLSDPRWKQILKKAKLDPA